jgi:hypothetical protein
LLLKKRACKPTGFSELRKYPDEKYLLGILRYIDAENFLGIFGECGPVRTLIGATGFDPIRIIHLKKVRTKEAFYNAQTRASQKFLKAEYDVEACTRTIEYKSFLIQKLEKEVLKHKETVAKASAEREQTILELVLLNNGAVIADVKVSELVSATTTPERRKEMDYFVGM